MAFTVTLSRPAADNSHRTRASMRPGYPALRRAGARCRPVVASSCHGNWPGACCEQAVGLLAVQGEIGCVHFCNTKEQLWVFRNIYEKPTLHSISCSKFAGGFSTCDTGEHHGIYFIYLFFHFGTGIMAGKTESGPEREQQSGVLVLCQCGRASRCAPS